jgi:hypothetical protein
MGRPRKIPIENSVLDVELDIISRKIREKKECLRRAIPLLDSVQGVEGDLFRFANEIEMYSKIEKILK